MHEIEDLRGQLGDATSDCDLLTAELQTARQAAEARMRHLPSTPRRPPWRFFLADYAAAGDAVLLALVEYLGWLVPATKQTSPDQSNTDLLTAGVLNEAVAAVLAGEPLPPCPSDMPSAPPVDAQRDRSVRGPHGGRARTGNGRRLTISRCRKSAR